MGDVIVYVGDDEMESGAAAACFCRICHESSKNLEAPCACSGTLKLAHRDCIQRWCNEKGNTICEICLQKFEDGYTAPPLPPKQPQTIRENLTTETDEETPNPRLAALGDEIGQCSSDRCVFPCRSVILILAVLVLMRHLFELFTGEARRYPFSLVTVLIIKVGGIMVPAYTIIGIITLIQNGIRQQQYLDLEDTRR